MSLEELNVFVACPSDCALERNIVHEVSHELESLAYHKGFALRVREWTQTLPDMGRPQQVIFDQLPVRNWDVFVGILWTRFGIPSLGSNVITGNDANSGTEEEFAAALNCFRQSGKPRILFYRRTGGPADILRLDTQQLALVQDFFKKFDAGQPFEGLYRKYEGPDQFRSLLRAHFQEILISGTLAYPPQVCTSISITDDFITPAILEGARARRKRMGSHLNI